MLINKRMVLPDKANRLMAADPALWPVSSGWQGLADDFFASTTGEALLAFLSQRLLEKAVIFPPLPLHALALTPLEQVRVVILAQDPYHGLMQAEGLAFSVAPGIPPPPSLSNIFKEIQRDLASPPPAFPVPGGSLVKWAENGVLLLNTCLTVEEGQPARALVGSAAKRCATRHFAWDRLWVFQASHSAVVSSRPASSCVRVREKLLVERVDGESTDR